MSDLLKTTADNEIWLQIIVLACSVLVFISMVLGIIALVKIGKLKTKYKTLLDEIEGENNTKTFNNYLEKAKRTEGDIKNLYFNQEKLKKQLNKSICKIGVVKYSAFQNTGNELSFSSAFLDEENSGLVITGIYSSEGCYVYCKEVINNEAKNKLSNEEKQALEKAVETGYKEE